MVVDFECNLFVHPAEQGLSTFCVKDHSGATKWVYYKTCHFGYAWAAYWWSRAAAAFIRVAHRFLHHSHFLCIYVDDALALFPRRVAAPMACQLLILACVLGFPLARHKVDLGDQLSWIGWDLRFQGYPSAFLPASKLEAMLCSLQQICATPRRVNRKELQTLVGRLVWYTTGAFWLKPWLQVWFHMLGKVRLRFQSLQREQLKDLYHCLDRDCRVSRLPRLCDIQVGWKLLEIGGHAVQNRADILCAPLKRDQAWLKFCEDGSAEICLASEELAVARFVMRLLHAVASTSRGCAGAFG